MELDKICQSKVATLLAFSQIHCSEIKEPKFYLFKDTVSKFLYLLKVFQSISVNAK